MKLYYMPGACSLAAHIVAKESDISPELVRVDGKTRKTESGEDYLAINPNGYVPALVLDDGGILTEVQVILQFLADQKPDTGLIPAGGMARYRVQQWLSFVSSELHKSFGIFFKPWATDEAKAGFREIIARRLGHADASLAGRPFLTGDRFTVADAYLWTVLRWSGLAGVDLDPYGNLRAFSARVAERPAVAATLREEGLG
jgi:glutathione S-transferase